MACQDKNGAVAARCARLNSREGRENLTTNVLNQVFTVCRSDHSKLIESVADNCAVGLLRFP